MCGLFGYINYSQKEQPMAAKIIKCLAEGAAVRGTHATGISYVVDGKVCIDKAPQSAYQFKIDVPTDVKIVMGHTRYTTQGAASKNYNNHPFSGRTSKGKMFSLAHNGILYNEDELRKELTLTKPTIETDSYVAVQVLEHYTRQRGNRLDMNAMKFMGEKVAGMFCFTVLDERNNLWITKNDNPLSIIDFKDYGIMVYASTTDILIKSIMNSPLSSAFSEALKSDKDSIKLMELEEGDLIKIDQYGVITSGNFTPPKYYTRSTYYGKGYALEDFEDYNYTYSRAYAGSKSGNTTTSSYPTTSYKSAKTSAESMEEEYLNLLCQEASHFGISKEQIEILLEFGYSITDVEDAVYEGVFDDLYKSALDFLQSGVDEDDAEDLLEKVKEEPTVS